MSLIPIDQDDCSEMNPGSNHSENEKVSRMKQETALKAYKKYVFVLLALFLLIVCSCKKSVIADQSNEVSLLRQTADSLLSALAAKDADRFAGYYDLNALFISLESGLHHGREDIKKSYGAGFALPNFYISGTIQDVQVSKSGDMGYTLIPWVSYFIPESGEKIERKGLNLIVWKKQDNGSWRVMVDKP